MPAKKRPARPSLPRVPLPRQTGGVHEDKTRRPARKAKHKKPLPSGDESS